MGGTPGAPFRMLGVSLLAAGLVFGLVRIAKLRMASVGLLAAAHRPGSGLEASVSPAVVEAAALVTAAGVDRVGLEASLAADELFVHRITEVLYPLRVSERARLFLAPAPAARCPVVLRSASFVIQECKVDAP